LGVKGAREILKILEKRFELGINMNEIDKEIDQLESDLLKRTKDISDVSKQTAIKKLKGKLGGEGIDYIG
jgi:proteasome assembly chaperone (PAC2) family protein